MHSKDNPGYWWPADSQWKPCFINIHSVECCSRTTLSINRIFLHWIFGVETVDPFQGDWFTGEMIPEGCSIEWFIMVYISGFPDPGGFQKTCDIFADVPGYGCSSSPCKTVWCLCYTRPGKRLQFANLKMAIEIVDLPIKNGDFP